MKKIFSFIVKQLLSIIIIILILIITNISINLWNRIDNLENKLTDVEQQILGAANNVEEWKDKLNDYKEELDDINQKISEIRKSWAAMFYEWWYEDELKELEKKQEKLKGKINYAKNKINYYEEQIQLYESQKETITSYVRSEWKEVLYNYVKIAICIIIAGWITFFIIKMFMYYIIAPLVESFKPICVEPNANGDINFNGVEEIESGRSVSISIGKVSLELPFSSEEEIITHQNYLQSSLKDDSKKTILLLSKKFFLTSIASGLTLMMSCRTKQKQSIVTLSPPSGIVDEIGIIDVISETKFVCKARAIVGIIKQKDQNIEIKRKWKFGLHSWITFQFRYLIFKGPCKLILKGSRGIKVESGDSSRIINRSRILGFSANMNYSNTRCETFIGYLNGTDDLFNNLFHKSNDAKGYFIYEEIPSIKSKNIFTKGFENFFDTILKIFGI